MKSSAIHTQNQRVQHISPTTVVVGIDIGKAQHVAQATDFRGIVLTRRSWAFSPIRMPASRAYGTISSGCSGTMAWTTSSWGWNRPGTTFGTSPSGCSTTTSRLSASIRPPSNGTRIL